MQESMNWVAYRQQVRLGWIKQATRKIYQLCARFLVFNRVRIFFYRCMGMHIGSNVYIGHDCFIDPDFAELITIEDKAIISFRVIIAAHDRFRERVAPVCIRNRAFIGAGAIILPGITVGVSSMVGAGAVVTRSVEDGLVVAGNPAKILNSSTGK